MLTHKLSLAPVVHDQDVLCVHTTLPTYLFVFRLNRILGLSLSRSKEDLELHPKNHSFAVYEYDSALMQQSWRVVENCVTTPEASRADGLFSQLEQRALLFPHLGRVDLLVCVNDLTHAVEKKIQQIAQVLSCYRLPKNHTKIKELLTF
jgi:hypothetical protein